jgi:hypothetical protein
VRENRSFAPLGLIGFPLLPTADPVGCTLTPLRGYGLIVLFCGVVEILVLTHTESAVPPRTKLLVSLPGYLSDLFKTHSGTPIYLRNDDDSTRIVGGFGR